MAIDLSDTERRLDTYEIPTRLKHAFQATGCLTVYDALQLTPHRLKYLKNSGVATIQA